MVRSLTPTFTYFSESIAPLASSAVVFPSSSSLYSILTLFDRSSSTCSKKKVPPMVLPKTVTLGRVASILIYLPAGRSGRSGKLLITLPVVLIKSVPESTVPKLTGPLSLAMSLAKETLPFKTPANPAEL